MQNLLFSIFFSSLSFFSVPDTKIEPLKINLSPPVLTKNISNNLSASNLLVLDADNMLPVYQKNIDEKKPMASLTKLMTVLLILENHNLNEIVKINNNYSEIEGVKMGLLEKEQFYLKDLISALLIKSANDVALVLAEYHSGSIKKFVNLMNKRAEELGLNNTNFKNPHGLDQEKHFSSARDLAYLFNFLLNFDDFKKNINQKKIFISSLQKRKISFINTNNMLFSSNQILGGKTGTTNNAKQCLSFWFKKNQKKFIVMILGSNNRYQDAQIILNNF
jgi:D-alanyl-D-alanine carboxypeptidase (penicillin-binding protein 5/6)